MRSIADLGTDHVKLLSEHVMAEFPNATMTAYPLALGYMVALTVNSAKGPERQQNLVDLLNGVIANSGFALTPVAEDHDA